MPDVNYEKYLVKKPAYEVAPEYEVEGRIPAMTLMSSNLVPGTRTYLEAGWIVSMPNPNPHIEEHTHDYDEIVIHVGNDPENPEELGGEIDFYMEGQPLRIDKSSAIYVPKGVKHGPLVWRGVEKPHLEMTIMIGAGSLAEADPAGYQKRREKL